MTVDPVAIAREMYACEVEKRFDDWLALFHDDVVVAFPLSRDPAVREVRGKRAWGDITRQKFIDRAHSELDVDCSAFADGRRAFTRLRVSIDFADGTALRNLPMATVITLDDGGLIVAVDELVNEAFFS